MYVVYNSLYLFIHGWQGSRNEAVSSSNRVLIVEACVSSGSLTHYVCGLRRIAHDMSGALYVESQYAGKQTNASLTVNICMNLYVSAGPPWVGKY